MSEPVPGSAGCIWFALFLFACWAAVLVLLILGVIPATAWRR